MKKSIRTALLLLLTLVCGAAWGGEVTFDPTTDTSSGQSLTKDGITMSLTDGALAGGENYEFTTGAYLSFSGADITKISFVFSGLGFFDSAPLSCTTTDYFDGWNGKYYWTPRDEGEEHRMVTFMATGDGKIKSVIVEYKDGTTEGETVNAPVISGETPFAESTTVTITADGVAAVYYTTDGSSPTTASLPYSAPFTLTETTTVKAVAVRGEKSSTVTEKTFTKGEDKPVSAPAIEGQTPFQNATTVTITTEDGTFVYYTLDGTAPTTASYPYSYPFTLTETTTVKAVAVRGTAMSEVAEKTFTKEQAPQEETYTIAQLAEAKRSFDDVVLQLNGAKVVYGENEDGTTSFILREDGRAIDVYSKVLYFPVAATVSGTVRLGVTYNQGILSTADLNGKTSGEKLMVYNPGTYKQDALAIQPAELVAHPGDLVKLDDVSIAISGQNCYGKAGDVQFVIANASAYNLKDKQTCDLTAWYAQPGQGSYVATMKLAEVNVHLDVPKAPVITGETPFKDFTTVTMAAEEGTTIHYTLDGSNPTTQSPLYTGPFRLTETTTVKALAERNELASPMAEMTFVKQAGETWKEVTIDGLMAGGVDVPNAILCLENAMAVFSADYGRSWVVRDGENAIHWNTSLRLATNYEYRGKVRVRVEYNGGFMQAYDIDGETTADELTEETHYGDYAYHFTRTNMDEVVAGQHKGDFIVIKKAKVTRETSAQGDKAYYAGEGEGRIFLSNPRSFSYYWSSDPTVLHDVGGWYNKPGEMMVARLRISVGTPVIEGEEEFGTSVLVSIQRDNEDDEIYYTLDGSEPNPDSENTMYYFNPFTLTETTTVRAIAVRYESTSDEAVKSFTRNPALGIGQMEAQAAASDRATYNLAGQRVGRDYRGIVVQDGHKVVRK